MTIEITSVSLTNGTVHMEAIDCSEGNLQRMERLREDGFERPLHFLFDTSESKTFRYLNRWLHSQKRVKETAPKTYGEALRAVVGTVTVLSGKYLEPAE